MRLVVACVLLLVLAGCAQPMRPVLADLDDGGSPEDVWMVHTTGCGFCGATQSPWADSLMLGPDGDVLWFSFRPASGMQGDDVDGVEIPPDLEHLRTPIEDTLAVLLEGGTFWARSDVRIYEARALQVADGDWPTLRMRLEGMTGGLDDPPPIEEYGCEDCSAPDVQVVQGGRILGGSILEKGVHGPGTGNVARGSAWDVIEESLSHLQAQAKVA